MRLSPFNTWRPALYAPWDLPTTKVLLSLWVCVSTTPPESTLIVKSLPSQSYWLVPELLETRFLIGWPLLSNAITALKSRKCFLLLLFDVFVNWSRNLITEPLENEDMWYEDSLNARLPWTVTSLTIPELLNPSLYIEKPLSWSKYVLSGNSPFSNTSAVSYTHLTLPTKA